MSLNVISPGFLSLLQDYGRFGYQRIGVTNGGPMDEHAFLWANKLLDNDYSCSMVEVSLGKFKARFTQSTMIAITGADMKAEINGERIANWQTHFVHAGDEIEFSTAESGLRAYLAVQRGFQVEAHLGSVATVERENIGGLHQDGKALTQGDSLPYRVADKITSKQINEKYIPDYSVPLTLRVILGYQSDAFSKNRMNRFFSSMYTVTNNINRMGYRLSGPSVNSEVMDGIVSEGISLGAIQVPKDGQPIVLMRDRQTIGGYPKLGCVSHLDLSRLAQRGPGAKLYFEPVDIAIAEGERLAYQQFFNIKY